MTSRSGRFTVVPTARLAPSSGTTNIFTGTQPALWGLWGTWWRSASLAHRTEGLARPQPVVVRHGESISRPHRVDVLEQVERDEPVIVLLHVGGARRQEWCSTGQELEVDDQAVKPSPRRRRQRLLAPDPDPVP